MTRLTTLTRFTYTTAAVSLVLLPFAVTGAWAQDLSSFGVLAGSTVTNTGVTTVNGNVGLSPGTSVTGFGVGSGTVTPPYTIHINNGVAGQAQSDLVTAYNVLAGRPTTSDLTGQDLGNFDALDPLGPGVYNFDTSAQLTGTLVLDAGGDPDAVFIFNVGSTLTTASNSTIMVINGGDARNVFFRVGSSATLGTDTTFIGRILALTSISLNTGTTIDCGAALARNGAVTLDTNVINIENTDPTLGCGLAPVVIGDDLDDETTSDNAEDVADAIDDFVDGGGELPIGFEVLDLLTPEELADALEQIGGEAASGVAPTGTQAMNSFLSLVLNSGSDSERRGPTVVTVKALGYAGTEQPLQGSAVAAFGRASDGGGFAPRRWEMWAAAFGGESDTDGDSSAGTHDRSSSLFGVAVGLDYDVSADSRIGVAISGGGTNFDLSDGFGGGSSDMFQVAVYGRTDFEAAYILGALGYAFHDVETERTLTFAGIDRFSAAFDAHNVAAQIEAGYRLSWITPYAALRMQAFHTSDYAEDTDSGASTFALAYDSNTATTVRTELGARLEQVFALTHGMSLALRGKIAWAHDYWANSSVDAMFQALPGSSFSVKAARPASDSLLLSAGAEVGFDNGLALAGWFDSEFADGSETYAGNVKVSYAW